jgi:hypothetical protein
MRRVLETRWRSKRLTLYHLGTLVIVGIAGMYGLSFRVFWVKGSAVSVTRLTLALLAHRHGVCRDP